MKKQKLLNKFGSIYIDFVRDSVLMQVQNIFDGTAKSQLSKDLSYKVNHIPLQYREFIKILIKASIDKTLHYTLFMLQEYEEDMQLTMQDENYQEHSLAKISDGLCGELYEEDGWIKKYSKYPAWTEDLEHFSEEESKF